MVEGSSKDPDPSKGNEGYDGWHMFGIGLGSLGGLWIVSGCCLAGSWLINAPPFSTIIDFVPDTAVLFNFGFGWFAGKETRVGWKLTELLHPKRLSHVPSLDWFLWWLISLGIYQGTQFAISWLATNVHITRQYALALRFLNHGPPQDNMYEAGGELVK